MSFVIISYLTKVAIKSHAASAWQGKKDGFHRIVMKPVLSFYSAYRSERCIRTHFFHGAKELICSETDKHFAVFFYRYLFILLIIPPNPHFFLQKTLKGGTTYTPFARRV